MSRFIQVELRAHELEEVAHALGELAVTFERASIGDRIMLSDSLDCAGEPVDIRVAAGVAQSVEDFGFVAEGASVRLVCSEVDRRVLDQGLIGRLEGVIARRRAKAAAEAAGLEIEESVDADGDVRIVVKE